MFHESISLLVADDSKAVETITIDIILLLNIYYSAQHVYIEKPKMIQTFLSSRSTSIATPYNLF